METGCVALDHFEKFGDSQSPPDGVASNPHLAASVFERAAATSVKRRIVVYDEA